MEKSIFCGREQELQRLKTEWDRVVKHGDSKVVVLLADNGLGKTRLVQEFFGWLSTNVDLAGDAGYWPDQLELHGDNLEVNPNIAECRPDCDVPFLWWGLRFQDVTQRNVAIAGMDSALNNLSTHLAVLMSGVRGQDRRRRMLRAMGDAGSDFALEFIQTIAHVSMVKTTANFLIKAWGIGREYVSDRDLPSLAELDRKQKVSKAEAIVTSLAAVFAVRDTPLPICIVADDAHFSNSDPDSVNLLQRLLEAARQANWPLLLLVTHWRDRWNAETSAVAQWLKPHSANLVLLPFATLPPKVLEPVLSQHLPGLLPLQLYSVLARADGNPQYLEEIIAFMLRRPKLFEALDLRGALTTKGLVEVEGATAMGRHELNTKRFQELPRELRGALAIGSLQGQRLQQDLTAEVAAALGWCEKEAALKGIEAAEMPHNLIRRDHAWGEFVQRLYWEIAYQELPNNFTNPVEVRASLTAALRQRLTDTVIMETLTPDDWLLTLSLAWSILRDAPDEEDVALGATAAAALMSERFARRDYLGAGAQAQALVDALRARASR